MIVAIAFSSHSAEIAISAGTAPDTSSAFAGMRRRGDR